MRPISNWLGRVRVRVRAVGASLDAEVLHHDDQLLHLVVVQVDVHVGRHGEGGLDGDRPGGGVPGVGAAKANLLGVRGRVAGGGVGDVGLDLFNTLVQDHRVAGLGGILVGHLGEGVGGSALALAGQRRLIVSYSWAWCGTV